MKKHESPDWQDEEFSQSFRQAPIGLCVVDRELRYLHVSDRLAEMNGRPVQQHLGRTLDEIIPEFARSLKTPLQAVLDRGEFLSDIEVWAASPGHPGVPQCRLENWSPLRSAEGEIWGALGAVLDITGRKQREESLQQAKSAAEAARAADQRFVARTSREMRTPLTAILGYAELLMQSNTSPGQCLAYAQAVRRNVQSLSELVDSVSNLFETDYRGEFEVPRHEAEDLGRRILLAEDAQDVQALFTTILQAAGLRVDVASDGIVALEMALATLHSGQPYGVLLMDVEMPGLDGLEVTRRLRSAGWRGPIVALTAFATAADRQRCLEAGCDAHLSKPITRQDLLDTVERYLEASRPAAAAHPVRPASLPDAKLASSVQAVREAAPSSRMPSQGPPATPHAAGTGKEAGTQQLRLLLAEDDTLVSLGVRAMLDSLPDFHVVAVACNGREAVQLAQQYQPDIVLMDITMPELDGLNATAQLADVCPKVKVIILSVHANENVVLQAMRMGARGYLLKSTSREELERALHTVARDEIYLCSHVSEHIVAASVAARGTPKRPTARQLEVLKLIAEGHSTKRIAAKLAISVKTAERHRTDLMKLLDIHETASLVRYAFRMGLVSAEE